MDATPDEIQSFFEGKHLRAVVEERNESEHLRASGLGGVATLNHTHWVDLRDLSNNVLVTRGYGSGMTEKEALLRARRRWASEQE